MKHVLVSILLVIVTRTAHADDPWAVGVPLEHQQQANELFAQANQLFAKQAHAPALEKYKAAIALWDHPLIRFNMAVTEIRLDRILDAAEDLDKALLYGVTPFTAELYQEALDYQTLIKKQVGEVEARCDQPDVHVLLDGKPWFVCPSTQRVRVLAGEHVIVGERKEYLTRSRRMVVTGGTTANEELRLVPIESALMLKYRYPRWLPFTVTGGGVVLALGGLGFWLAGRSQMDRFVADFTTYCPAGCKMNFSDRPFLADERDSAQLKGRVGIAMIVAGGAVTATGLVLTIVNSKAKRVLPSVELAPGAQGGAIAHARWSF